MADERALITSLLELIAHWEYRAREARQWMEQWQPGDLPLVYLQGCADQLERNAKELRDQVDAILNGTPRSRW